MDYRYLAKIQPITPDGALLKNRGISPWFMVYLSASPGGQQGGHLSASPGGQHGGHLSASPGGQHGGHLSANPGGQHGGHLSASPGGQQGGHLSASPGGQHESPPHVSHAAAPLSITVKTSITPKASAIFLIFFTTFTISFFSSVYSFTRIPADALAMPFRTAPPIPALSRSRYGPNRGHGYKHFADRDGDGLQLSVCCASFA
jgi:hypothetical protein